MNNETNSLQKPKRPILTGNEKVDELLEDGYQCQMSIYNRWLQSQSLPAVEQPEDRNMQDGYYLDCYNNGCQLNCPKCPDKCKVEQPVLSNKIGHINCDSEALKDPEFVNAVNRMTELAYHKTAPSQPEGKTLEEVKALSVKRYGNDINSFGQQRDGFVEGYTQAMQEYANQPCKERVSVSDHLPDVSGSCSCGVNYVGTKKSDIAYDTEDNVHYTDIMIYHCPKCGNIDRIEEY